MSAAKVSKLIKDNGIKFVDLRFTDTRGKEQHVTLPSGEINAGFFEDIDCGLGYFFHPRVIGKIAAHKI